MSIVSADFGGRRIRRRVIRGALLVIALLAIFWLLPRLLYLYTEWLWFNFDVRFPNVFWTVLTTKVGLGLVFGLAFLLLVLGNVALARRLARRTAWYDEEQALRQRIAEAMEYFVSRYLYLALVVFAVVVAYGVGLAAADHWNQYLLFRHGGSFGIADPIFNRDVGFYIFRLPFWQYLWQWSYLVLIAVLVLSAATHYLDKAIRVLRGLPAFAPHVKAHLSVLLGLILVLKALGYRIEAFYLLYSPRGATFGASYTDVHAQLLALNVLFIIALACAALVLINLHFRGLWLPLAGIGFLAFSSLLLNVAYPALVQRFHVEPNEFGREKPYIQHTIRFTRQGFDLHQIEERNLRDVEDLTMGSVNRNLASVENVRLWDYRPLLDTYQQQQALWPYYRFHSIDIDRYHVDGRYRQVMLAARELWSPGIPETTWQKQRIFYTHGYGVVMSPVSDVIQSGLPDLVLKNIPPESSFQRGVERPGIYYGELTNDYVIVRTTEKEYDYPLPAANQAAETTYVGESGVPIGSGLPRLAAAARFRDVNIIVSTLIGADSRILWGRNVGWRGRHIAPFLSYDRDPYIVVGDDGRLYWIQDAYTTSGMYPYSEPFQTDTGRFNYVRNSIKVVTDAYDGTVTFFVADPDDPIIQTYQKIFPALFRPMDQVPAGLLAHIRYPEAFFNTQSARLTVYHMTDPLAFYRRSEKWEIAREAPKAVGPTSRYLGSASSEVQGETMQAYYAIIKLPDEEQEEFLLMLPFTPQDKPNMVAWLAARCDGKQYGKLLVYNFPKTEQVWGPIQIEASISQDTEISQLITLWNQQGSSVIRGNLLVIPIDNSILYVEPLYLKAAQSPIPELKRVVVALGDGRVVMEPSLSEALAGLLGGPAPDLATKEPAIRKVALPAEIAEALGAPEAAPAELPADARSLARQADRQFKEALERQRDGDWAGYGEAVKELQQTLEELVRRTAQ
jgi:uncharacterized membrane protein (UPF0182 family)